jgi:hypothetical protein
MNRTEFTYWLAGVQGTKALSDGAKAELILEESRRQLGLVRAAPEPPGLLAMRIGDFCVHNRNVREHCDACSLSGAVEGVRIFAVFLPVTVKQVFVSKEKGISDKGKADVGMPDLGDDSGTRDSGAAGADVYA